MIKTILLLSLVTLSLCLGGFRQVPLDYPGVSDAAMHVALQSQLQLFGGPKHGKLIKAEVQVVAGTNFRLTFSALKNSGVRNPKLIEHVYIVHRSLNQKLSIIQRPRNEDKMGGFREVALDYPGVQEAAMHVMKSNENPLPGAPRTGKLTKAEVQVVAGINFRLTFDAIKNSGVKNPEKIEHVYVVHQGLDKEFQITMTPSAEEDSLEGAYREVPFDFPGIPEAVLHLEKSAGKPLLGGPRAEKLVKAEVQVVAGINYKLTFEGVKNSGVKDPVKVKHVFVVHKGLDEKLKTVEANSQEDVQLVAAGGFREVSLDYPGVAEAVEHVMKEGSEKPLFGGPRAEKLVKAEVQVVAGINFRLTFEGTKSSGVQFPEKTEHVFIVHQGLDQQLKTLNSPFKNSQDEMLGGFRKVPLDYPGVSEAAMHVALTAGNPLLGGPRTGRLVNAEVQVVNGLNFRLTFVALKNSGVQIPQKIEHVYVVHQGFDRKMKLIKSPQNSDDKMVGGFREISTEDPGVVGALNHLLSLEGANSGRGSRKIQKVLKAEVQVVNGLNYRLTLRSTQGGVHPKYDTSKTHIVVVHVGFDGSKKIVSATDA